MPPSLVPVLEDSPVCAVAVRLVEVSAAVTRELVILDDSVGGVFDHRVEAEVDRTLAHVNVDPREGASRRRDTTLSEEVGGDLVADERRIIEAAREGHLLEAEEPLVAAAPSPDSLLRSAPISRAPCSRRPGPWLRQMCIESEERGARFTRDEKKLVPCTVPPRALSSLVVMRHTARASRETHHHSQVSLASVLILFVSLLTSCLDWDLPSVVSDGDADSDTDSDSDSDADSDTESEPDGDGDVTPCAHPVCGLSPQCGCPAGHGCYVQEGTLGCFPAGTQGHGEACSVDSDCAPGATCPSANPGAFPICLQYCVTNMDCYGLAFGSICDLNVPEGFTPFCTSGCDPFSATPVCDENMACDLAQLGPDGPTTTVCRGELGSGTFGASCSSVSPEPSQGCGPGLRCFNTTRGPMCGQFCRYDMNQTTCVQDNDCAAYGGRCVAGRCVADDCPGGTLCYPLAEPFTIEQIEVGVCQTPE